MSLLKRFFKASKKKIIDFIIPKMIVLGLLLSAWAIFSIEIPWIPKLPTCMSESVAIGWNKVFLALAYSYVAGVIIYWLTVRFPYLRNKKRILPVVNAKIRNIGVHLSVMNLEFREGNGNPEISDVEAVMAMFTASKWKERCKMPEHGNCRNITEGYIQDYIELQGMVDSLINDYKDYFTTDQLLYLELLRSSSVNQFLSTAKKCDNRYVFSDAFYETMLQPSYRRMLEVYNKLVETV